MNECATTVTRDSGSRYERAMRMKTPAGGWKKADLASLGVSWPPKRGWLSRLRMEHESAAKATFRIVGES